MQLVTVGQRFSASSALALSGILRPPRTALVGGDDDGRIAIVDAAGAALSGEKPPNTTEWIAPMRAQASMATATSGIIGR